jgi:hypothetical protein
VLPLVASGQSDTLEPENADFTLVGNEVAIVGLFVVLFVGFGLLLVSVTERLDARLPAVGEEQGRVASALYLFAIPAGLVASLVLLVAYLVDNDVETTTGTRPDAAQVLLGLLLLALLVVTLYQRLSPHLPRMATPGQMTRLLARGLLVAAVVVGGYQAAVDIADIV